jgi:sarcosine oxidase gamma subunit
MTISNRRPSRRPVTRRRRAAAAMAEALEPRQLFSLLGVLPDFPQTSIAGTGGQVNYTAATSLFAATAVPTRMFLSASDFSFVDAPRSFQLNITISNVGTLGAGSATDLVVTGNIDVDGDDVYDYSGTLLTGKILQYGYDNGGTNDTFDFRFQVTGGTLAGDFFTGKDVGLVLSAEGSTFNGTFATNFTSTAAKGVFGPIPQQVGSPPVTVGDFVWHDLNANGVQDSDEPGINGVTLTLTGTDANGNPVTDHRTTAGNGGYLFVEQPGTYTVTVDASNFLAGGALFGYTASPTFQGGNTALDSNASPTGTSPLTLPGGSSDLTLDFGYYLPGKISGLKFKDITGNGFSVDDTPLAGVTIQLFKVGNATPVDSKVTAADGSYAFTGLAPGSYYVQELVPTGWVQTGGTAGYTVPVASGTDSTGNNFADFQKINLSGKKFEDKTGNGISGDDTAWAGVTIQLFKDGGGSPVATTVTGADGTYSFADLGPGSYTVKEVLPAGSLQTVGGAGYTVNATSGTDSTGNDFANFKLISISGKKFEDKTGNGISGDDTAWAGVTIQLFKDGGATPVATTTTAADGTYNFANLGPGTYTVAEVLPSGSVQTVGNSGYSVNATSGTNATGKDFANFKLISISGKKYNDLAGDGNLSGDPGLGGVTINLYKNGAADPVATTVTAADGTFTFSNLGPGSYTVKEVTPSGWVQTVGASGYTVSAVSGVNSTGNCFANFKLISISGKKFNDLTGNGITSDDTAWAGVTIQLFKNSGTTPVATTTTAADGTYSFSNLGPGSYSVKEVVPSGSTQTVGAGGLNVTAVSGTDATGKNFANFKNVCISGLVFCDDNLNGVFNAWTEDRDQGAKVTLTYTSSTTGQPVTVVATSDAYGYYSFTNVGPATGKYTVALTTPSPDHLAEQSHGDISGSGIVTIPANLQISLQSGGSSSGNNFAEIAKGSLSGDVFNDFNNDGCFQSTEDGIDGVSITLTGKNYLGQTITPITVVTDDNGHYLFDNLLPGMYTITEAQPEGYVQGKNKAGSLGGYVSTCVTDTISCVFLPGCDNDGTGYTFGERGILSGRTGTIGFWANMNGQKMISLLGATSTSLGNWLASTYPNIYGKNAGLNAMAGKTNVQIAARFIELFKVTGMKLDAQVLATALSAYTQTLSLNSTTAGQAFARQHGFELTAITDPTNLLNSVWNVGRDGEAFGVADYSSLTVSQILAAANKYAVNGVLWANGMTVYGTYYTSTVLRTEGNETFSGINVMGDILG